MISTKGRYALRFLIDLAENQGSAYIPLKDISERQEVSLKYAERIMTTLAKAGFVDSQHGKGGGYRLLRAPSECRAGDVLRAMGEELAPVACLACESGHSQAGASLSAGGCHRAQNCRTLPMWRKLDDMINDFFNSITLATLTRQVN